MNISLTPKLESFVRQKVSSGFYSNSSEVVRDALRLLAAHEADHFPEFSTAPDRVNFRNLLLSLEKELRQRGVIGLALLGPLIHVEPHSESHINIVIDIAPQAHFSLVDFVNLKLFLEDKLGRDIDLAIREVIDPQLRDRVLEETEAVFS